MINKVWLIEVSKDDGATWEFYAQGGLWLSFEEGNRKARNLITNQKDKGWLFRAEPFIRLENTIVHAPRPGEILHFTAESIGGCDMTMPGAGIPPCYKKQEAHQ
jgi:hypothetical protein